MNPPLPLQVGPSPLQRPPWARVVCYLLPTGFRLRRRAEGGHWEHSLYLVDFLDLHVVWEKSPTGACTLQDSTRSTLRRSRINLGPCEDWP